MISDEQLNAYRLSGERIRVVRDALESNDVNGIVVAWDATHVMIRKRNRKIVKLDRNYSYRPFDEPREAGESKQENE
ncbi:hypothetical protein AWM70_04155 [Paenibacillus yonginensis]|uniref:Uncharacterized protein n=1 Tax=Paenibacillus yonginensis TaxID=1462996 RepID=A0A1B1MXE5_9BACL|nr:hypothetical protein [Paenibacillus yonginensis]ANS73863.1 hypothetical protein AWM70_04155 [Paenibacillus yonginensis]